MTERIPYGGNVTIWQLKERIIHVGNVTNRHLQRVISFNTIELYMKEKSTHAGSGTIRQLQRVISLNTSNLYMKNYPCGKCDYQDTDQSNIH